MGCNITYEDYKSGYAFFPFDLSPDLCTAEHFNLLRDGALELEVQLKDIPPAGKNFHAIFYLEFDNIIGMYEDSIETVLENDPVTSKIFLGALARNEVGRVKYPCCMIINNEPRSMPGGHWVALYYTKNKHAYFFDSYGYPPSFYRLQSFVKRTSNSFDFNKERIQGSSEYCGLYAVMFCLFFSRNKQQEFFSNFSTNYTLNDKRIRELLNN